MNVKSPQTLISEASKEIKTITAEEALKLTDEKKCNLIDLREEGELNNNGSIENSTHIPRGLLEFSLNQNSPLVQNKIIDINKEMVLFCAAGGRSALAAKTLNDMGFKNVSHIDGGFNVMTQKGFKIKK
ncbi:MAG: rhodanese [Candidatus Pelagibacter sp.]|nr:rhodanese [Candidatus Pelagibacter sp.]|tara:strand:+ start:222 stop:608 length:387 start_codon:yes stop_codon:yes gene_type:complete